LHNFKTKYNNIHIALILIPLYISQHYQSYVIKDTQNQAKQTQKKVYNTKFLYLDSYSFCISTTAL